MYVSLIKLKVSKYNADLILVQFAGANCKLLCLREAFSVPAIRYRAADAKTVSEI